jgi:hypothetical protein
MAVDRETFDRQQDAAFAAVTSSSAGRSSRACVVVLGQQPGLRPPS